MMITASTQPNRQPFSSCRPVVSGYARVVGEVIRQALWKRFEGRTLAIERREARCSPQITWVVPLPRYYLRKLQDRMQLLCGMVAHFERVLTLCDAQLHLSDPRSYASIGVMFRPVRTC